MAMEVLSMARKRSLAMEICRPKGNSCAVRGSCRCRISHLDMSLRVLLLPRRMLFHCDDAVVVVSSPILRDAPVFEQQWTLVNSRLHHCYRPVLLHFPLQSRKMNWHDQNIQSWTSVLQLPGIAEAWCSIAYSRIDWRTPFSLEVAGCSRSLRCRRRWPRWYRMAKETDYRIVHRIVLFQILWLTSIRCWSSRSASSSIASASTADNESRIAQRESWSISYSWQVVAGAFVGPFFDDMICNKKAYLLFFGVTGSDDYHFFI